MEVGGFEVVKDLSFVFGGGGFCGFEFNDNFTVADEIWFVDLLEGFALIQNSKSGKFPGNSPLDLEKKPGFQFRRETMIQLYRCTRDLYPVPFREWNIHPHFQKLKA